VAKIAGLRALPRLQATFRLARQGADGLRVNGEVSATVGQNCVVTLDPIDNEVQEEVDLVFTPPSAALSGEEEIDEAVLIDPGGPEPLTMRHSRLRRRWRTIPRILSRHSRHLKKGQMLRNELLGAR
jgi:hypothetical protein